MVSYHKLACHTFAEHEVHGKSILDTIRGPRTLLGRLFDRRRLPMVLGAACKTLIDSERRKTA